MTNKMTNKKWRFYRLSPNAKFLHYNDFLGKTFIRDGVEGFPESSKLELGEISQVKFYMYSFMK